MPDRLTSMQIFARVAALGSFAAAGREAGMSQTMVTRHIASLESRLGSALFHRSTRRLSLTEAGRIFLDGSQRILNDLEEVEQSVSAQRSEPRGCLRLNAPVSFAVRHLAPLLPEFHRLYPHVQIELGLNDREVDLIEEGWDLTLRIKRMASSTLKARKLANIRFTVCASPEYLERAGTPRTIAELSEHTCLGYTLSTITSATRWVFGAKGTHSVPVQCSLLANNGDVLREAALAGQGIIYQPVFMLADELRRGRLVCLTLDQPVIDPAPLHAVYAPATVTPLKVRVMIDFLASHYLPQPPWEIDLP
ncbi:MAG: LysR family transcriptional regulator [Acetobacter sp.]|jgi:DNA-binding transcriptional LysR family regulator|nr:LysR family transcriptional regulator [Acetobacter sp.]MCH4060704.1 LysR family transcriptional regulator [Acetobacter sp.]MCH4087644.1 LysR family transcriptional regulator [Acetobacter sp.]MCI1294234.1 LysR family transcriptional regulator [Acetobacter sp.]MCI1320819.1 LysR family transcriptional regulator [Acetobacter sp.]